jgi:hypothetical protein
MRYNEKSEHIILPQGGGDRYIPKNGSPTEYVGTVVLRRGGSGVNHAKYDVYFMESYPYCGIEHLGLRNPNPAHFTNPLNSPGNFEPIFDCDAIKVFAEEGYYFVDEATNQKSLSCFNIRYHKKLIKNTYYKGCGCFCSDDIGSREVVWVNGIPRF